MFAEETYCQKIQVKRIVNETMTLINNGEASISGSKTDKDSAVIFIEPTGFGKSTIIGHVYGKAAILNFGKS